MAEIPRTASEVRELLQLAKALHFDDDIEHWTQELKKLEGDNNG